MSEFKVPLSKPYIGAAEKEALLEVLESGQLSLGPKLEEFEKKFADVVQCRHAVAVSSGTTGLHLAVKTLGIKEGDEVITTPFSFVASTNCILYEKAKPVFVDVEEETFGINPQLIEDKITSRTKAILAVHVFGKPCQIDNIQTIAKKYNLRLIEDSCESLLSHHPAGLVGSFGDVSVYGFYPNKQITTGEGGMVTTNNPVIFEELVSLRNQGRSRDSSVLVHDKLGYNYRMSDLHAALGLAQLDKIEEILAKRRLAKNYYYEKLSKISGIKGMDIFAEDENNFVIPIRVNAETRNSLILSLAENGIQSKAYFNPPIHQQPYFRYISNYESGDYPVAERLSKEILILPFFTGISNEEIDKVVECLVKFSSKTQKSTTV